MKRLRDGENDTCETTQMLWMNGMIFEKKSFQTFELKLTISNFKKLKKNLDLRIIMVIFQHLKNSLINFSIENQLKWKNSITSQFLILNSQFMTRQVRAQSNFQRQ